MESFYVRRIKDVRRNLSEMELALGLKLRVLGNRVSVEGDAIHEYEASIVFDALNFGFSVKKAMLLKNEDFVFHVVKIKEHTRRKIADVKARLIGKKGKTRRVFSDISDCEILVREGEVGIIGSSADVESAETAVINLIKGSKQTNMYRYLEKQNKRKKEDTSFRDLPR